MKKKKKLNRLECYTHPDNLPAERFFLILKTNDLRHLLITKKLPEKIPNGLDDVWELIVKEYEKLSKDKSFTNKLEDVKDDAREINALTRLRAIFMLMKLGDKIALQYLEEEGMDDIKDLSIESQNIIRNRIIQETQRLEIQALNEKAMDSANEPFNFLKALTQLSNLFKRQIPRDVTLTEWIFLIEDAKEMIKHGTVRKSKSRS